MFQSRFPSDDSSSSSSSCPRAAFRKQSLNPAAAAAAAESKAVFSSFGGKQLWPESRCPVDARLWLISDVHSLTFVTLLSSHPEGALNRVRKRSPASPRRERGPTVVAFQSPLTRFSF